MFNWLGNLFPYSDLHSLNLDWILSKMKETAAQAAKAIADSANALAQVAEAKAAALTAQTAASNAQTAASNAQTAASGAAESAENAVSVAQTAQTAAQNARSTAETAQSLAETAQSLAETAQSLADTANSGVNALKSRFPIKQADIADAAVTTTQLATGAVTIDNLYTLNSYLWQDSSNSFRFPASGNATIDQISTGIVVSDSSFLLTIKSEYLQLRMNIVESGTTTPNTAFSCSEPIVHYTNKNNTGLIAIAPIVVIKNETNDLYHGFIKISRITQSGNKLPKCEVIFQTAPPFNDNTGFTITVKPVAAKLSNVI